MLLYLQTLLSRLTRNQKAQDLTEYALLVALIAIVVVVAVIFFGNQISIFFSGLGSTVSSWLSP